MMRIVAATIGLLAGVSLAGAQDGSVGSAGQAIPSTSAPQGVVPPNGGEVKVPEGTVPKLGGSASPTEDNAAAPQGLGPDGSRPQAGDALAGKAEAVANRSPISAQYEDVGDWRVECYEPAIQGVRCQILQQVVNRQAGQPIAIISIAYLPDRQRSDMEVAVPLGFKVQQGVKMTIRDFTAMLPVDTCSRTGCLARTTASTGLLEAMNREASGTIALTVSETEVFTIPFSLRGFNDARILMETRNRAYAEAPQN